MLLVHAQDDWDIPHAHSAALFAAMLEPHLPALPLDGVERAYWYLVVSWFGLNGVAGTPEEAIDTLAAYAEAGSSRVYLQMLDLADLDHLDLVASEIAPHLP